MGHSKEDARAQDGRVKKAQYEKPLQPTYEHETAAGQLSQEPAFASMWSYVEAGYQLIRLHRHEKRPLEKRWTLNETDPAKVLGIAEHNGQNVGVRLRPTDLIIDADPRNYGGIEDPDNQAKRDCLAELAVNLGLDLSTYPHVSTGGGGHHYYLHKPEGEAIVGSLAAYPGVEFKSAGQQVVAAGSVHPSGKHYESQFFILGLTEAPDAPVQLLDLIRRPGRPNNIPSDHLWGELTPELLAKTLAQLDPCKFSEQEEWLNLMMACHHATAGDGREEFIEWSTGDPEYQEDRHIIGSRWDSLHTTYNGGKPITVNYLHKVLHTAGKAVARTNPEDDFGVFIVDGETLPVLRRMKNGKPESTFLNCLKLVRHISKQLGLVYDEFGRAIHLAAPELPWITDVGRRLDDDVLRRIRQYLVEVTEMNWGKDDVMESVLTVARENPMHPVREYLAGLTWDGVPRIDKLLVTYAGAADNEYIRAIGGKALIAAVRRVRQPGCKFDNVIVLEGEQGCGKSSFVKSLSPNLEWFSDSPIGNTELKDAPLSLQGRWIIELGEMSVLSKSGVEALKAFVSSSIDHVRRPYGRMHEELKRQCIFIGTTNQATYLKDQTGNRRFWPVLVGAIDLVALVAHLDQLWAEASAREATGESLFLPQALWSMAAVEQEERVAEDPWADILRDYLDGRPGSGFGPIEPLDRVHSTTLLTLALHLSPSDQTPAHTQRLKMVMEKYLHWKHKHNLRDDGRQGKGYQRQQNHRQGVLPLLPFDSRGNA